MNELTLLGIELFISLSLIIILYKFYSIAGLYTYATISAILTCIMSLKTINIYNYDMNLGIISLITIFTASNIIIQKKGPDETKNFILTTVSTTIIAYIILFLVSLMTSSNIALFTNASYNNIFNDSLRILFANIVTILYSLILNTKLYYYLKRMKNNILISNFFSTIIIHFISSIIFSLIAYTFIKEPIDIIKIIMIRYLMSLVVGLTGTIAIYWSKYIKEK